jgi:hypothetical protein
LNRHQEAAAAAATQGIAAAERDANAADKADAAAREYTRAA